MLKASLGRSVDAKTCVPTRQDGFQHSAEMHAEKVSSSKDGSMPRIMAWILNLDNEISADRLRPEQVCKSWRNNNLGMIDSARS
jgi:hypothetical protein